MPYDTRLNHIESQISEIKKILADIETNPDLFVTAKVSIERVKQVYQNDLKYWEAELIRHKQRRQKRGVKY